MERSADEAKRQTAILQNQSINAKWNILQDQLDGMILLLNEKFKWVNVAPIQSEKITEIRAKFLDKISRFDDAQIGYIHDLAHGNRYAGQVSSEAISSAWDIIRIFEKYVFKTDSFFRDVASVSSDLGGFFLSSVESEIRERMEMILDEIGKRNNSGAAALLRP